MDAYTIIITPNAEEDLRNIRNYIALVLSVPDVALHYIQSIRKEIEKLSYLAKSIAPIESEPWHSRGVRKSSPRISLFITGSMNVQGAFISWL